MSETDAVRVAGATVRVLVLNVDGTLVDTAYLHTLAWDGAFRAIGAEVPMWVLHRHAGMGGERLVAAIGGMEVERVHGARLRALHRDGVAQALERVRALPGARHFVESMAATGMRVVPVGSGDPEVMDHLLRLVGVPEASGGPRPSPHGVRGALGRLGHTDAMVIGATVWDCRAAAAAGVPAAAVLTGGVGAAELRQAGARHVADSLASLGSWIASIGVASGWEIPGPAPLPVPAAGVAPVHATRFIHPVRTVRPGRRGRQHGH